MTDLERGKALRSERLRLKAEGYLPHEIETELLGFRKATGMVSQTGHAPQRAPKTQTRSPRTAGHVVCDRRVWSTDRRGKARPMSGVGIFRRPRLS